MSNFNANSASSFWDTPAPTTKPAGKVSTVPEYWDTPAPTTKPATKVSTPEYFPTNQYDNLTAPKKPTTQPKRKTVLEAKRLAFQAELKAAKGAAARAVANARPEEIKKKGGKPSLTKQARKQDDNTGKNWEAERYDALDYCGGGDDDYYYE